MQRDVIENGALAGLTRYGSSLVSVLGTFRTMVVVNISKWSSMVKKTGSGMTSHWTAILIPVIPIVVLVGVACVKKRRKTKPIPGLTPTHSVGGNIPEIKAARSFSAFLKDLHLNYGPIATFWYGRKKCCSLSIPEYYCNAESLFDRPTSLFHQLEVLHGKQSIILSNGSDAKRRHVDFNRMLSHFAMAPIYNSLRQLSSDTIRSWEKNGEQIPVQASIFEFTARATIMLLFGINPDADDIRLQKLKDAIDYVRINKEKILLGECDQQELQKVSDDIADICVDFMTAKNTKDDEKNFDEHKCFLESIQEGVKWSNETVLADVTTFLIESLLKTSNAASMVLYHLASHLEVQEICYQELEVVLGGDELQSNHVGQMRYIRQILNESLRISNIVPFTTRHNATSDFYIDDYCIPKGLAVIFAHCVTHEDENIYPEPQRFEPARFSTDDLIPEYGFEPYGFAGERRCPGLRFTNAVVVSLLATLLENFSLKFSAGQINLQTSRCRVKLPRKEFYVTLERRIQVQKLPAA